MVIESLKEKKLEAFLLLILFSVVVSRFLYISNYAATWDQVDFALALDWFDLRQMQPHFPGYPYFILGGSLIHQWISDPIEALVILNKIMFTLSIIPMYGLARAYINRVHSLVAVLVWQSLPYGFVLTSLPMSEAMAISIFWWYLWFLHKAILKPTWSNHIILVLIFSVLMGIRISYIPVGVGLVFLWLYELKQNRSKLKIIFMFLLTIISQFIWIGALIISEGSLENFIELALGFTGGHFSEWGVDINRPIYERIGLTLYHFTWSALSTHNWVLLLVWTLIILRAFLSKNRLGNPFGFCLTLLGVSYFLWVIFGQNVEKARHLAPLLLLLTFWAVIVILKASSKKTISLLLITIMIQSLVGVFLMKEQKEEVPATIQLVEYLDSLDDKKVVYAWEEIRMMDYYKSSFPYKRVYSFPIFANDRLYYKDSTIYLTDHVVNGFKLQGIGVEEHLRKIQSFQSNPLFDQVYYEITLYEWID
ncbi:glycosyltransferase family 39 protein [Bacillaceae bacterium S4-13-58]